MSINSGAVLQFSLLAHTVPVSVELDRDEVEMKVNEEKTKTEMGGVHSYIFTVAAIKSTVKRCL